MGFLGALKRELRNYAPWDDYWYSPVGIESKAGVAVSEYNALSYLEVFKCVDLISRTLAFVPTITYRKLDRGKERATNHPNYRLLRHQVNPRMTAFRFKQTITGHLLTWGNGYSQIIRARDGRVAELYILRPDRMKITGSAVKPVYEYRPINPQVGREVIKFKPDEILHIPGFGFDGIKGYSLITLARQSIGMGLALEEHGARYFSNDSRPGGVLKSPRKVSDNVRKNVISSWENAHRGIENKHKVALLEDGIEWQRIGIPPEDSQFLETRQFQAEDIDGFYHVPPHMVGHTEKSTSYGTGIEHQTLHFLQFTMEPWFALFESEYLLHLFAPEEREVYFAEFLQEALLRADSKARAEFYKSLWGIGSLSADQILEKENMNPLPPGRGGDLHFVPLNMIPLDQAASWNQPSEEGNNSRRALREQRSLTMADNRRKVVERIKPRIEEAAGVVVRSEVREVKKAVERFLNQRDIPRFQSWLFDFYVEHRAFIRDAMAPSLLLLAEEVRKMAAEEIVADGAMTQDFEDFANGYVDVYVVRHAGSSRGQLGKLLNEATEEDAAKLVLDRLESWGDKRAGQIASREAVEGEGAFTQATWVENGIQEKEWRARGDKNCPYCTSLNGKRVNITQPFVAEGDFQPEGAEKPLRIRGLKKHPPIHRGCDCQILPVI